MRISTNSLYEQGVAGIENQQADLMKTQQQMSSGKRILTPADDPIAAANALQVGQASSINDQYAANRSNANGALGLEDSVLQNVTSLLQSIRTNLVSAGNASLTDADRSAIVTSLTGQFQELMGLANSTDASGQYLFSGYAGGTQPYSGAVGNVSYNGDQGQRVVQAATGRQIAVSDSGTEVFDRVKTGNGVFATSAASGNTGTGTISVGSVTGTPTTQDQYTITFHSPADGQYDVTDATTGATVASNQTYQAGGDITVNGWTTQITGAPAAGDSFTLAPSGSQSLFKTLGDLISAIGLPASTAAGNARLTNALGGGLANLDQALNNVLSVRAGVGTRMQELASLDQLGSAASTQYQQTLSQLQDVDYTQAASDLTREQTYLTAAQKSFTAVTGLSLFSYL